MQLESYQTSVPPGGNIRLTSLASPNTSCESSTTYQFRSVLFIPTSWTGTLTQYSIAISERPFVRRYLDFHQASRGLVCRRRSLGFPFLDLFPGHKGVSCRVKDGSRVTLGSENFYFPHRSLQCTDPLIPAIRCVFDIAQIEAPISQRERTSEHSLLPIALVFDVSFQGHLLLTRNIYGA